MEVTEENSHLPVGDRHKTFFSRLIAAIVDALLLGFIIYIPTVFSDFFPSWLHPIGNAISVFDMYIYAVLLHGLYGQTFGKMLMLVKVVNHQDESDITFRQAFMRDIVPIMLLVMMVAASFLFSGSPPETVPSIIGSFLSFATFFGFIWIVLEFITMLMNEKRRAIHDYIAGTVVVNV